MKVVHNGTNLAVNKEETKLLTINSNRSSMIMKVACAYFGSVQVFVF